jgi:hypothetical protein
MENDTYPKTLNFSERRRQGIPDKRGRIKRPWVYSVAAVYWLLD